ncbi:MAG: outer membrane lipoprotein carrier protein LolA [Rhodobacteraceae bacterium]|nr:outer membrane lipoprotein carrier protein LolA [Paracoccaceae bacterium]
MRRFLILCACLLVGLLGAPAFAEKASLSELSAYLNSIRTVEADFTQYNADGSTSRGKLYIQRPGRVRFEYAPPNDDTLVVASGGTLAVFDGRASGKPEKYPLNKTPLSLILSRNIDLNRVHMVTGHGEQNGRTIVQAQDPDHPEYGRIYLYFEENPIRLSEWLIISESGEQTRVKLGPLQPRSKFSGFLFDISNIERNR